MLAIYNCATLYAAFAASKNKQHMDPAERRKKMPARIIAEFLTGRNLRKVFSHLCNNASGQVTDPISDTAIMMLTCPVQLILTEVGVALFKDRPTSLFPFTRMDSAQRYFVEEIVRDCLNHCNVASSLATKEREEEKEEDGLPFYRMHHHAVVQMGGGCILYMHERHPAQDLFDTQHQHESSGSRTKKRRKTQLQLQQHPSEEPSSNSSGRLKAEDVLKSMCDCIFASTKYGDADVRLAICSILLQRIMGMCGGGTVSREEQRAVHAYCEETAKEWRAKESVMQAASI